MLSFSLIGSGFYSVADQGSSVSSPNFWTELARSGVVIGALKILSDNGYKNTACVFGGYVALSELEKQNKSFFNDTLNIVRTPYIFVRKRFERLFCSGESLSWNELITWRTRVMKLLSPLTKQTTVVDLSREKRLRLIDQEDSSEAIFDEQWAEYVRHIENQCSFLMVRLDKHLNYYQDRKNKEVKKVDDGLAYITDNSVVNPIKRPVVFIGKSFVRASIKRDEEIAFYLEELKTYLQEIITYTKSVTQLSSLDKDRIKQMMNSTCDVFEHVATLIDANTAASGRDAVGQLTIQPEKSGPVYTGGYSPYMGA